MGWTPKMQQHFTNYKRNQQFQEKMRKLLLEIEKKESKQIKSSFQKLLG